MANETVFRDGAIFNGFISGSGSINVSGNSEFGDFSTDTHRFTGSLNISGSGFINDSPIITESDTGSIFVESASYADTAGVALNVYISASGQDVIFGTVSGSNANFDSITANNLYITETTRSVIYESGSTAFGDTLDDTHTFTGSMFITGSSFTYNGSGVITDADTGSMTVESASYAISASHAVNADIAISSSYAVYADTAGAAGTAISSSYSVYADTAGTAISSSYAVYADTAGTALNVYISQSGQDATLGTITATNISASGWISASAMVSVNTLDVNGASYTTNQNSDVDIGTEVVDSFSSGGLCSAEWLACIKNVAGANYRTSKVLAVWDNTGQVEFTEYSTKDIGNTNGLDLNVIVTGSNIVLQATATSNDWEIKVNRITI